MTIDDIAQRLGVDKSVAYGLVRFLEAKRLVQKLGDRKNPGARGKGAKLYGFKANVVSEMTAMLSLFATLPE